MDAYWPEFIELIQNVADLGARFLFGDVLDIIKIILSIAATVWFGRRYVKRHLRKLLDQEIQEIASEEQLDRADVKATITNAIDKARGVNLVTQIFDVNDTFETAARYCAQRQPEYGIEILESKTVLSRAAAELSAKRAQNSRMQAATAQLQIGLIRRHQGDSVRALYAFKGMLKLNPGDIDGLRFSGQELEKQGRLSEAAECYNEMKNIGIGAGEFILQGEALRGLARVNDKLWDAIKQLNECLEIEKSIHHDVGVAYTWKTMGDLRRQPGHWKKAEVAYENALKIFRAIGHAEAIAEIAQAKLDMAEERRPEDKTTFSTDTDFSSIAHGEVLSVENRIAAQ